MTIYSSSYFSDPNMTVTVEQHTSFSDLHTWSPVADRFDVWITEGSEGQTEAENLTRAEALRIAKEIS
jgi:hypothetical protein